MTASITPDGSALVLWASPPTAALLNGYSTSPSGVASPQTVLDQPVTARVTVHQPDKQTRTTTITDLRLAHPHIALLPDGELLIVGARCAWTPRHVEPNAVVYSASGQPRRQAVVGDGVHHLRTSAGGAIWIGYSDEGVFGNLGWSSPGPTALGQPGLVRYDTNLNLSWKFEVEEEQIADLEAMNVVGETIWSCYYTEYSIARVDSDAVTIWWTRLPEMFSPKHILIDDDRIALVGDHVIAGRLDDQHFVPTATRQLALPAEGQGLRHHTIAHGPTLHVITADGQWMTTDLDELTGKRL